MERGPLIRILEDMKGSDKELNLVLMGQTGPIEIRNVVDVHPLRSTNGMMITTRQNYIWLDAEHVSAAYQARADI